MTAPCLNVPTGHSGPVLPWRWGSFPLLTILLTVMERRGDRDGVH